jgi:hypothetical protein
MPEVEEVKKSASEPVIPVQKEDEDDRFLRYEPQERLRKKQGKKLHKFRKNAF